MDATRMSSSTKFRLAMHATILTIAAMVFSSATVTGGS
jgi:hypothetical protein